VNSPELERDLAGVRSAHARLLGTIADLTDAHARQPSLLPDWSVGHVLTHIARNADGLTHMVEEAGRGVIGDQYPGGMAQRNGDIEAGAPRSAAELRADVTTSAARLEAAWSSLSVAQWDAQCRAGTGQVLALSELPYRRWREVVIHHSDLGLAFTPDDWPEDFVGVELRRQLMRFRTSQPMGLTELPPAALALAPRARVAWLLGRARPEGLPEVMFG